MTLSADIQAFVTDQRPHGTVTGDAGEVTPNGYPLRRDVRAMDHATRRLRGSRDAGAAELISSGLVGVAGELTVRLVIGDERPHVRRERHWITWSARTRTDCGIVRPSAFAVRRLIASSNFLDCSIGSSAGVAPLMIR
jgi:hypothetical protein